MYEWVITLALVSVRIITTWPRLAQNQNTKTYLTQRGALFPFCAAGEAVVAAVTVYLCSCALHTFLAVSAHN